MAQRKSRFTSDDIVTVECQGGLLARVKVTSTDGREVKTAVGECSRPELLALRLALTGERSLASATRADLEEALTRVVNANSPLVIPNRAAAKRVPKETPAKETPMPVKEVEMKEMTVVHTTEARAADGAPDAERVLADLGAVLGAHRGVDEDAVRRIVAEETAAMRPTVVRVPERPDITIQGRTHALLGDVLAELGVGNTPYLVGPAGTGKSSLARQCAESLGVQCATLPTNPTMSETKLMGYFDALGRYVRTSFRDCWEDGGVFLLDEIDNGHPAVVKAFNEFLATEAGQAAAFPDGMVPRHKECFLMAAANTFGLGANRQYVGASQLDASTLDRFVTIEVDYDRDLELALAGAIAGFKGEAWCRIVHKVRGNIHSHGLRLVASTRMVVHGARSLHGGVPVSTVFERTFAAGVDSAQLAKATEGIDLNV